MTLLCRQSDSGAHVPTRVETWPIIEHEPEREQVVPPDLERPPLLEAAHV